MTLYEPITFIVGVSVIFGSFFNQMGKKTVENEIKGDLGRIESQIERLHKDVIKHKCGLPCYEARAQHKAEVGDKEVQTRAAQDIYKSVPVYERARLKRAKSKRARDIQKILNRTKEAPSDPFEGSQAEKVYQESLEILDKAKKRIIEVPAKNDR